MNTEEYTYFIDDKSDPNNTGCKMVYRVATSDGTISRKARWYKDWTYGYDDAGAEWAGWMTRKISKSQAFAELL